MLPTAAPTPPHKPPTTTLPTPFILLPLLYPPRLPLPPSPFPLIPPCRLPRLSSAPGPLQPGSSSQGPGNIVPGPGSRSNLILIDPRAWGTLHIGGMWPKTCRSWGPIA